MERLTLHTLMSVDYIVRRIDKFGKTVFLTREEAEKALSATMGLCRFAARPKVGAMWRRADNG